MMGDMDGTKSKLSRAKSMFLRHISDRASKHVDKKNLKNVISENYCCHNILYTQYKCYKLSLLLIIFYTVKSN